MDGQDPSTRLSTLIVFVLRSLGPTDRVLSPHLNLRSIPQLSPLVRVTVTNLWQLSLWQMVSADTGTALQVSLLTKSAKWSLI